VALLLLVLLVGLADARTFSWLGVRIRDLSEQEMEALAARHGIREGFGVMIADVMEDSPASRAGVQNGDIVVDLEGRPIVEVRMLQRLIGATPPGRETRLIVLRRDGRHALRVALAPMPRAMVGERVAADLGFALRDPGAGEPLGIRPGAGSPAVAVVMRGSPAERAGLTVGDVIVQVNERPVLTREAASDALAEAAPGRPLELVVRRGAAQLPLTLPTP
jgi:serine protease Do